MVPMAAAEVHGRSDDEDEDEDEKEEDEKEEEPSSHAPCSSDALPRASSPP